MARSWRAARWDLPGENCDEFARKFYRDCKKLLTASLNQMFIRRIFNRLLHLLARFLPGATSLRPLLHRLRGVRIARGVFIGDEVYLDNEHPDAIELREGALIGLRSTIVAHTRGSGKVVVGKNVVIGAGTTIVCSGGKTLEIGEGSVVCAGSVVGNSIPPFTFCGSARARALATVTVPFTLDTRLDDFLRGLKPLSKSAAGASKNSENEVVK
jgi:serine acetyltransferase